MSHISLPEEMGENMSHIYLSVSSSYVFRMFGFMRPIATWARYTIYDETWCSAYW